MVKFEK